MEHKVELDYISAACNRIPECMDWGTNNLICYGACNCVIICDPTYNGISYNVQTLYKHTERINCVRWIRGRIDAHNDEIVSGSNDKTAIVWQLNDKKVNKVHVLKGHTGVITVVDALYSKSTDTTVIATASIDYTVKIWLRRKDEDFVLAQDINLGRNHCLSIRLCVLPSTQCTLLALGLDNNKIYLYNAQHTNNSAVFGKIEELIGHEDWVRGLDFTTDANGDVLLASSSQDTYVRLWRICKIKDRITNDENLEQEIRTFKIDSTNEPLNYCAILESVLSGHENWVYGVHWHRSISELGHAHIQLLSSSMDKTMIIWKFDEESQIWLETMRVGEVGGNTLGLYGGKFSPDGNSIIGHGYQGSFHLWNYNKEKSTWSAGVTIGGHFEEVVDMCWEPLGQYLLTVSADQTTRLHGEWKRNTYHKNTWHELARPQVHGYDMTCVAVLSRYNFVSGAEEKVIRSFQATNNFRENFRRISSIKDDLNDEKTIALGASVPSLGLSNKAVYDNTEPEKKSGKDIYPENYFVPLDLFEPPTEDYLMQNTLWPEVQKLYGHGYEIYCVATTLDGKFLASACKANNAEHASVIIWSTATWKQIQKLTSHQLTVTQLEFSPDSQHLLSVSRDRRWTIFSKSDDDLFHNVATTIKEKAIHTRIIWCCSWMWDSNHFLTGSRDGKVAIWGRSIELDENTKLTTYKPIGQTLDIKESVTAITVSKIHLPNSSNLVAIGTDIGTIYLYECTINSMEHTWINLIVMDQQLAHHLTVKRLRFRPDSNRQLASCGADHLIKIYSLDLANNKVVLND